MTILDNFLEFCDDLSLILSTGTNLIGDVIDLGSTSPGIGAGEPLYWVVTIGTAVAASGGAATINFQLVSDAQAAIATDGSATVHAQTGAISKATLIAGYRAAVIGLPMPGNVYERYLGVLAVIATNNITAGTVNSFITHDVGVYRAFPDASN